MGVCASVPTCDACSPGPSQRCGPCRTQHPALLLLVSSCHPKTFLRLPTLAPGLYCCVTALARGGEGALLCCRQSRLEQHFRDQFWKTLRTHSLTTPHPHPQSHAWLRVRTLRTVRLMQLLHL